MTNIEWVWIIIMPVTFFVTFLVTFIVYHELIDSFLYSLIGFILANIIIPVADATFNLRLYAIGYYQGFVIVGMLAIGISITLAMIVKKLKRR